MRRTPTPTPRLLLRDPLEGLLLLRLLLLLAFTSGCVGAGLEGGPPGPGVGGRQRPGEAAQQQQQQRSGRARRDGDAGGRVREPRDDLACSWPVVPRIVWDNQTLGLEAEALHQKGFPAQLHVALEVEEGEQLLLDLQQNWELLAGTQGLVYYLPNGTRAVHQTGKKGNCCYWGVVRGHPESSADVCVCSGLSGLLVLASGRSYHLESSSRGTSTGYRLHRLEAVRQETGECEPVPLSHGQSPSRSEPERPLLRRGKRQAEPAQGYVELVIVADRAEFQLDPDLGRIETRMVEIASFMDRFYRLLGLRIALVGLEVWNEKDRVLVDGPPRAVLDRFLQWKQKDLLPRIPHDSAQLIIGSPFVDEVGASTQASICSGRSGGISMDHSVSAMIMASTLSHQLGHNLGLLHDRAGCGCDGSSPDPFSRRGCIMERLTGFMSGLSFSSCSHQQLQRILQSSRVGCLLDVPHPTRLVRSYCGNSLVESGEECDCGLRMDCSDPCCNARTCRLVPGAQCATGGRCCHECKLRGAGFLCRGPLDECDLPEYCDGTSPRCPANVHKWDGTPCGGGQGACFGGICPNYTSQCQELWGPGSVAVSDACVAFLNGRGDSEGHCGQQGNGAYIPCAQRDAWCGRLQCQEGRTSAKILNQPASKATCPHTPLAALNDTLDMALVLPGTACGAGKVCVQQQCQELASLPFPECRCNGHGVCNNQQHCHCSPGWAPPDCQSVGTGGSVDSGPPPTEQGAGGTSTALVLSALLLILVLAIGLFCAKRVGLHKRLCQFGKGTSCQYRAESQMRCLHRSEPRGITQPDPQSYSQAPPERPRPPQWRSSTELQLMLSSKPTPLDTVRPDPPSKPLPPDPIPKGQQVVSQNRPAPPMRPLPADPIPKDAQPPGAAKPPPPRKPLPSDPFRADLSGCNPQVVMLPSRPAPLPPPHKVTGPSMHIQEI